MCLSPNFVKIGCVVFFCNPAIEQILANADENTLLLLLGLLHGLYRTLSHSQSEESQVRAGVIITHSSMC